jgi:hypothetical protein
MDNKGGNTMKKAVNIFSGELWKAKFFIAVFLIFGWMSSSFAQERKVDINLLVQETQKLSPSADEMTLVWWLPEEFWRISFEQNPNMTAAQTEEFMKVLHPYIIIVAIDGKIGAFGGVTYESEATIKNSIQIIDSQGTYYRPLDEEKTNPDTKNFLSMMKPVLVNMLGPMGQNMHFILFPSSSENGKSIADAKKEGSFSVKLGKREFKWRLPLGSLLPLKVCPVDGEKLSGAWKFCPWHGAELK